MALCRTSLVGELRAAPRRVTGTTPRRLILRDAVARISLRILTLSAATDRQPLTTATALPRIPAPTFAFDNRETAAQRLLSDG